MIEGVGNVIQFGLYKSEITLVPQQVPLPIRTSQDARGVHGVGPSLEKVFVNYFKRFPSDQTPAAPTAPASTQQVKPATSHNLCIYASLRNTLPYSLDNKKTGAEQVSYFAIRNRGHWDSIRGTFGGYLRILDMDSYCEGTNLRRIFLFFLIFEGVGYPV